jgi:hypothetical protein
VLQRRHLWEGEAGQGGGGGLYGLKAEQR